MHPELQNKILLFIETTATSNTLNEEKYSHNNEYEHV
jgi:hypothetical protein